LASGQLWHRWALAALLTSAVAAAIVLRDRLDLHAVEAVISGLGFWGPAAFVAFFAAGTLLLLPGGVLGLAGGLLFGPVWGTALNLAGGTIGAILAFVVARYLAGDWVRRRIGGRLQQIVEGVEGEGWRFVALVRLVPLIPFNLANYALGLTRISLVEYALATAIAMVPGTAAYAWLGHAGRGALTGDMAALRYGLLGLAALAAIALLPRLLRRVIRKPAAAAAWIDTAALADARAHDTPPCVIDVRNPEEFTGPLGHIPGAINIPVDQLVANTGLAGSPDDRQLVLVCRTDRRSAKAAEALRAAGYRHLAVLRGGMESWNAAGLPVEAVQREPFRVVHGGG
jgi:uncharacterized membrane protein YdjX (TVP38/TMEM64 family)/rhodanese-related sulfurtransferase